MPPPPAGLLGSSGSHTLHALSFPFATTRGLNPQPWAARALPPRPARRPAAARPPGLVPERARRGRGARSRALATASRGAGGRRPLARRAGGGSAVPGAARQQKAQPGRRGGRSSRGGAAQSPSRRSLRPRRGSGPRKCGGWGAGARALPGPRFPPVAAGPPPASAARDPGRRRRPRGPGPARGGGWCLVSASSPPRASPAVPAAAASSAAASCARPLGWDCPLVAALGASSPGPRSPPPARVASGHREPGAPGTRRPPVRAGRDPWPLRSRWEVAPVQGARAHQRRRADRLRRAGRALTRRFVGHFVDRNPRPVKRAVFPLPKMNVREAFSCSSCLLPGGVCSLPSVNSHVKRRKEEPLSVCNLEGLAHFVAKSNTFSEYKVALGKAWGGGEVTCGGHWREVRGHWREVRTILTLLSN